MVKFFFYKQSTLQFSMIGIQIFDKKYRTKVRKSSEMSKFSFLSTTLLSFSFQRFCLIFSFGILCGNESMRFKQYYKLYSMQRIIYLYFFKQPVPHNNKHQTRSNINTCITTRKARMYIHIYTNEAFFSMVTKISETKPTLFGLFIPSQQIIPNKSTNKQTSKRNKPRKMDFEEAKALCVQCKFS